MFESNKRPPGLLSLLHKATTTGMGALQNRAELFLVEWQEERSRLAQVLVSTIAIVFFAMLAILLLTGAIIFLVPDNLRIYVAIGFAALYLLGSLVIGFVLKNLLKHSAFHETLDQAKKDKLWLESLG